MTTLHGFGSYSLREIQSIFNLTEKDFTKKILIYGAGASYLNNSVYPNIPIICADPLYQLTYAKLKKQIDLKYIELSDNLTHHTSAYTWHYFSSAEAALTLFQKNSQAFLDNFEKDQTQPLEKRKYLPYALPHLPFADNSFDLLLCLDNFFASTSTQTSLNNYHLSVLSEFKRLAHDIRIFPLTNAQGHLFPNLGEFILSLQQHAFGIEIKQSQFAFQVHADALLKIWPQTCSINA